MRIRSSVAREHTRTATRSDARKGAGKGAALSPEEQDITASQILASLADEEACKNHFAARRDEIRQWLRTHCPRMTGARPCHWTTSFDPISRPVHYGIVRHP